MKIGFLGLGKLGLPCALAIESKGHEVKGYELDPKVAGYIKNRKIPYREEGAEELLAKTKIEVVDHVERVVSWADITFIAVQTPHDEKYEGITRLPDERIDFDYNALVKAIGMCDTAGKAMEEKPIVSVISTVLPGTMDRLVFPEFKNIRIVYNPFFIAMGTTVYDFLNPEFVLLGVDDAIAAERVTRFYEGIYKDSKTPVPLAAVSVRTAEAVKVLYNTYITQKIVFANAAMELCHYTGADVDDVIDTLSLGYRRITSASYMRAGMGDGGGCHPRDNIALSAISRKYNISYDWWESLMLAREKQTEWLAEILFSHHKLTAFPIVILGKSFKPETNLTVGSPSILLYNLFLESTNIHAKCISMYDPHVDGSFHKDYRVSHETMLIMDSDPKIWFIGTKHEIFKTIQFPKGSIIFDPFRYILDQNDVTVIRIGEGK